MSLARTALRIAAVAALNADATIASLCPDRVFDSRIDDLDTADPVPVIVVLTEDDTGNAYSVNNGGPPFDHKCDLMIEISLRVVTMALGDDGEEQPAIGMPETDAEAEATLDLLEERAVEALTVADTPQAALIRKKVTRRVTELKSIRYASAESGSKLALRMVTLTTHLKINQIDDAREVATGPLAQLPEPLRSVALSLPTTSSGYQVCAAIAAKIVPPQDIYLEGIDATYQASELNAETPSSPNDPNQSEPYDARIDLGDQ